MMDIMSPLSDIISEEKDDFYVAYGDVAKRAVNAIMKQLDRLDGEDEKAVSAAKKVSDAKKVSPSKSRGRRAELAADTEMSADETSEDEKIEDEKIEDEKSEDEKKAEKEKMDQDKLDKEKLDKEQTEKDKAKEKAKDKGKVKTVDETVIAVKEKFEESSKKSEKDKQKIRDNDTRREKEYHTVKRLPSSIPVKNLKKMIHSLTSWLTRYKHLFPKLVNRILKIFLVERKQPRSIVFLK